MPVALHNQVRGFYPGCVTQFRDQGLKVMATIPLVADLAAQLPSEYSAVIEQLAGMPPVKPGTVAAIVKNFGVVVQTGDGLLLLHQVQPAGKKAQSGWDFANGLRVAVGEAFGRQERCIERD